MAPTTRSKRAAPKTVAPAAKKGKEDPLAPKLKAVKEAIAQAESFPQTVRAMLCAQLQHTLATPADKRHEVQEWSVKTIGEVLEETRSQLQEEADAEQSKVKDIELKKEELEKAIEDAAAEVDLAEASVKEKEDTLAAAQGTVDGSTQAVTEAKAAETEGNEGMEKDKASMESMQETYDIDFKKLRDDDLPTAQAKSHLAKLSQGLADLGLDASLMTTMPAACLKAKSARGSFDAMVFDELEKGLTARIAALSATVAAAAPAAAERAAVVARAEEALAAAQVATEAAQGALTDAQAKRDELVTAQRAAVRALSKFLPEHKGATAWRDEKVSVLQRFDEVSLASFKALRDRTTPEPVCEAAVAEDGA